MAVKDEYLPFSSGVSLAGLATSIFFDHSSEAFTTFKDEIFESIIRPNKLTAIHHFLFFFQDIEDEVKNLYNNDDDLQWIYKFLIRTLDEVNLHPNMKIPDFDACNDDYHEECACREIVEQLIDYISVHQDLINNSIVHAAFQFIFQDRKFLRNFHLELAKFIQQNIQEIRMEFHDHITAKGRIKRKYFPEWLKQAVFYRDKGTCSNPECRCDLTGLVRTKNKIHIDHVVPLDLYGSNDASNFQLLCETCNTSKGARTTTSSSINVPYWNLDYK